MTERESIKRELVPDARPRFSTIHPKLKSLFEEFSVGTITFEQLKERVANLSLSKALAKALQRGAKLRIKRTSGEIESDWVIDSEPHTYTGDYTAYAGKVVVTMRKLDSKKTRPCLLENLIDLNID